MVKSRYLSLYDVRSVLLHRNELKLKTKSWTLLFKDNIDYSFSSKFWIYYWYLKFIHKLAKESRMNLNIQNTMQLYLNKSGILSRKIPAVLYTLKWTKLDFFRRYCLQCLSTSRPSCLCMKWFFQILWKTGCHILVSFSTSFERIIF